MDPIKNTTPVLPPPQTFENKECLVNFFARINKEIPSKKERNVRKIDSIKTFLHSLAEKSGVNIDDFLDGIESDSTEDYIKELQTFLTHVDDVPPEIFSTLDFLRTNESVKNIYKSFLSNL